MNLSELYDFTQIFIEQYNQSNIFLKVGLIVGLYVLIVKYTKGYFVKYCAILGQKIFNHNNYIKSFFENETMVKIAFYLIPVLVLNYMFFWRFDDNVKINFTVLTHTIYVSNYIFVGYWLSNFLKHTVSYLNTKEKYKDKPLLSLSQIIFIIFIVICITTIYAHFTNQSPKTLFTTLSVMSMAIFWTLKDVILGIISTVLIIANDIVKVGDWIKNEKYHADGDIIEINLITVKVLNFDKTITTIPTYSLISEGFQNHQEILKSGKRLLKHSFRIDPSSVKYLSMSEIEKFKHIDVLRPYIEKKLSQSKTETTTVIDDKQSIKSDDFELESSVIHLPIMNLNSSQITNLGLFRKYVEKLAENNSMVFSEKNKKTKENGENIVIRILEGTREGIGLELYCFSKKVEWDEYNYLIAQLAEQVYASSEHFDLIINS